MTIYTFNLLVGFELNGVDVAQASRAKCSGSTATTKFCLYHLALSENWPITSLWGIGMRLLAHLASSDQQTTVPQRRWEPCKWSFN